MDVDTGMSIEQATKIADEFWANPSGQTYFSSRLALHTLAAEVRRLEQLIASTPREWFAYDKNTGHGHVYPRTDGLRARCGGPGMCDECSRDQVRKAVEAARERGTK